MPHSQRLHKSICVPFCEDEYTTMLADRQAFRAYLQQTYQTHPELFPAEMSEGFRFHGSETAYLAILIDIFTRAIRGWELELHMSEQLVDQALGLVLAKGISPEIHHSDHGGQYIAKGYCDRLIALTCQISMAAKGKPWENPFAESVIGHVKDELVWTEEFTDFQHAYFELSHFLDVVYNHQRSHSSLGYLASK